MLQLTSGRDLSQAIVHVDMDAFFAAVEMRDDISLLNKPMAVGSLGMLVKTYTSWLVSYFLMVVILDF